jgi:hypothetical protein
MIVRARPSKQPLDWTSRRPVGAAMAGAALRLLWTGAP